MLAGASADLQYATDKVSGPAIRIFFWPQFLVGVEISKNLECVLDDCAGMFLSTVESDPIS